MTPVEKVDLFLSVWKRDELISFIGGSLLVTIAILSSLVVGIFADHLTPLRLKSFALLTAACTALLASFSPLEISKNYHDAWVVLSNAKFKSMDSRTGEIKDSEALVAALQEGERIIARNPAPSISTTK